MNLLQEKKTFKDKEGKEIVYYQYYVVVSGVNVYLKPVENIGKQLLNNNYIK